MASKRYRHYKGQIYTVIGRANHTENWDTLVVYSGEDGRLWARPFSDFYGKVLVNGMKQLRFTPIPDLPETLDETTERWHQEAKAQAAKGKGKWQSTVGMENDYP